METLRGEQEETKRKKGETLEVQRLTAASVVLTADKDDFPETPLFQEPVWDITECIPRTGSDPFAKGGYADIWKGIYTWSDRGKPGQEIVSLILLVLSGFTSLHWVF